MELKSTAKFQIIEDSKHEPDLKAAQQFVGGMVQGIEFPNGDYMIMNEEGNHQQTVEPLLNLARVCYPL